MHLSSALLALASALTFTTTASATVSPPLVALPVLPPSTRHDEQSVIRTPKKDRTHDFTLRHIYHHGTHKHPDLHRRLNVPKDRKVWTLGEDGSSNQPIPRLRAQSRPMHIQRLADRSNDRIDALLDAGRHKGSPLALDVSAWTIDEVTGPNITNQDTIVTLAKIAANAYAADSSWVDWEDVKGGFNYTEDFGWQNDGLRGHIFADTDNKTVIVGLKGTSPAVFDGSETTTNDKINDNLFFSCCCGQGGQFAWKLVCDCQTSAFTCNATCVVEALRNKNRYYYAAQEIYRNVSGIYPDSEIWLVGHSLGGATSALVGLTYGIPAVTFEAPGDAMAASRLGLPTPPGYDYGYHQQRDMTGVYQFGHTADPIYVGSCNTIGSVCTIAGYAMQSVCHSGMTCSYDTVKDFGWRVGAGNHRVKVVIHDVIEKYSQPAACAPVKNCTDCYNWKYFESHDKPGTSKSSTTSKATSTATTRTSTCKTPGWWGCLDETTTSKPITTTTTTQVTTTTTTTTTTTCETPGWFGCKDPTTVLATSTRPSAVPTMTVPPPTVVVASTVSTTVVPTSTLASTSTSPTNHGHGTSSTSADETCRDRAWYGWCRDWSTVSSAGMNLDL